MTDLLFGYSQYLTFMDEIPLFNTDEFISNKPKNQKKFFEEFTSTQIFTQFLQTDTKEYFPYFIKIENQIKNKIKNHLSFSNLIPKNYNLDVSKFYHILSNSQEIIVNNKIKIYEPEKIIKNLNIPKEIIKEKQNNVNEKIGNNPEYKKTTNYIIMDDYLVNFKEIYYLFPYFHEANSNIVLKSEYINNYKLFSNLMCKYFGEENKYPNIFNKTHFNSLILKKIEFPDTQIKNINRRVFENFRFLNMQDIPCKILRYKIRINIFI